MLYDLLKDKEKNMMLDYIKEYGDIPYEKEPAHLSSILRVWDMAKEDFLYNYLRIVKDKKCKQKSKIVWKGGRKSAV